LNDCEMQHNAEVGLFTRPSILRDFHLLPQSYDPDQEVLYFLKYRLQPDWNL
jgi:hypothetical protein